MKKSLLSLFGVTVGVLSVFSTAMAQTPASGQWLLNSTTTNTGNGSGEIIVSDQTMSGLNLKGYNDITAAAPSTTGINENITVNAQRLNTTDTDNKWPANETAPVSTRYTEYQIAPAAGKDLKVQTVSIDFGDAGSTSMMRVHIYYSIDDFATQVRLNPVTDPDDGLILPKYDANTKWMRASYTTSVLVPNTKTFKLRVYPWWPSSSSNTKYLVQSNVNITGVTGAPGTLPLNFLSFTAKPDAFGKTVALNWSTTNEVNTASFAIQKRTDNGDFATIGNIPSKNTAGVHHYSFADNNASAGNSYYRIVQYDNDHSSSNSEVQAVSIKASAGAVNIYPNPVADVLNANHSALQAGATAKISNSNGSTVLQQALTVGATQSSIDVSSLKPGVYILSISGQAAQKFVKR